MKTRKLTISLALMAACVSVGAQTSFDAAKLYEEELNGTARYVGMGGAMSALGSDPSVISHNPAGIGTYRSNDVNMSLSFFGTSVSTDPQYNSLNPGMSRGLYYYSNNIKSDLNMALDNFSTVFSGYDGSDLYLNFGFSYRKLQNMDRYLDYMDKFYDFDLNDPSKQYVIQRQFSDHQRNKINSFDFNISCNLSDVLYLGWTLGILSTDTWSEGYFYEFYPKRDKAATEDYPYLVPEYSDNGHDLNTFDKMNTSKGSGLNMAFGAIIRPIPALRFGVSIKTPTYFRQRMEYQDYTYSLGDTVYGGVPYDPAPTVEYKFSSPWRVNLSAGFTFGHTAIGVEYEKNFTQRSSLSISNVKMLRQGANDYQDYASYKIGIEQNISNLSLRAGYNYIESMFKNTAKVDLSDSEFNGYRLDYQIDRPGKTHYITTGIGYCSEPDRDGTQFYFDLAYVHGVRKSVLNTNERGMVNARSEFINKNINVADTDVNYKYVTDKILFTVGWNF